MAPWGFQDELAFVWKVADMLRGTFKRHEYGSVILSLLALRMDAVLAPTKVEPGQAKVAPDIWRSSKSRRHGVRTPITGRPRPLPPRLTGNPAV